VYDDPATMFTAAFLSSPPINLVRASVRADQNDGVFLGVGDQQLRMPWTDPRATALVSQHGSFVTLGIRADAMRPDPDGLISGRVRTLEFHGHEWLAHVEAGVVLVDSETFRDDETQFAEQSGQGGLLRRLLRTTGILAEEAAVAPAAHDGTHRRSDLIFRMENRSGVTAGDTVRLSVDTGRILLFGEDGRRIDKIER
jgi:multiple sugar transport system ATP-binding protein